MPKISVKTCLTALVSILSIFFLMFLGALFYYIAATTVKTSVWTAEIDGTMKPISPEVVVETKDMTPFAAHLEGWQKKYLCNCIVESNEQVEGGYGGAFGYGKTWWYWRLPSPDDVPFRMRHVLPAQTLIRQRVTYKLGNDHFRLDWCITIYGWLSEDGKYYFLQTGHLGGNFAGIDIDYYADYHPETQRLTLHVRQKLHWQQYKRYKFEFELQDDPAPKRIYYGEEGIPSKFAFVGS